LNRQIHGSEFRGFFSHLEQKPTVIEYSVLHESHIFKLCGDESVRVVFNRASFPEMPTREEEEDPPDEEEEEEDDPEQDDDDDDDNEEDDEGCSAVDDEDDDDEDEDDDDDG